MRKTSTTKSYLNKQIKHNKLINHTKNNINTAYHTYINSQNQSKNFSCYFQIVIFPSNNMITNFPNFSFTDYKNIKQIITSVQNKNHYYIKELRIKSNQIFIILQFNPFQTDIHTITNSICKSISEIILQNNNDIIENNIDLCNTSKYISTIKDNSLQTIKSFIDKKRKPRRVINNEKSNLIGGGRK